MKFSNGPSSRLRSLTALSLPIPKDVVEPCPYDHAHLFVRDAYIKNGRGEKVVDFQKSNLHVMSYSVPVRQHMSLVELKRHLYTLPDQPELIPYRTSYYSEGWAFCMAHSKLEALQDETYEV